MEKKEFKEWEGHLILYCKNHYKYPKGFLAGLRMIWAIRCGYSYDEKDKSVDRNIANKLYSILIQLAPEKSTMLQERIHEEIHVSWKYETLNSLEKIIAIYCSEIANTTVCEKKKKRFVPFIILPKPNKRVFNRILRGNGKYQDYYLIDSK